MKLLPTGPSDNTRASLSRWVSRSACPQLRTSKRGVEDEYGLQAVCGLQIGERRLRGDLGHGVSLLLGDANSIEALLICRAVAGVGAGMALAIGNACLAASHDPSKAYGQVMMLLATVTAGVIVALGYIADRNGAERNGGMAHQSEIAAGFF